MNRYIDAEWLKQNFNTVFWSQITKTIDSAPSIDIVRCGECKKLRDCRHDSWQKGVIEMGYVGWCEKTSRLGDVTYVKDSDFCSYGCKVSEIPTGSERSSE